MVKLTCAVVGEGSAFSVDVGDDKTVGDLKQAVKSQSDGKITVPWLDLKLFLGKKDRDAEQEEKSEGGNEWLVKVRDTLEEVSARGCEPLLFADAPLSAVGLAGELDTVSPEEKAGGKGNVHVLVEVPRRSSEKREWDAESEGFSTRKMLRADTRLRDLWDYPRHEALTGGLTTDTKQLEQILEYPWPFKLAPAFDTDIVSFKDLFDPRSNEIHCEDFYKLVGYTWYRLSYPPISSASEDAWHTYYDALLLIPLRMLGVKDREMNLVRNQRDKTGTTVQKKRPDVIMHFRGLVLLRGEEKCGGEGIQKPLRELTSKMHVWSPILYGELPWTLGYATRGETLHIVMITRNRRAQTILTINSIIRRKDYAIQVFYNLAFVMEKMISVAKWTYPDPDGLFPFEAKSNEKRTLELQDDRVVRTMSLQQCGTEDNFERLTAVYRTLESVSSTSSSTVTHLQTVLGLDVKYETDAIAKVDRPSRIIVGLSPLGMHRDPENEKEVRQWLQDMLIALTYWHGAGYCHGDIQWRNIVYVPIDADSGYWVLIDMDESYKPNTKEIDWNHQAKGEVLRYRHDLLQVGKLLKDSMIRFEESTFLAALRQIQEELVSSSNPDLSAEDVLALMESVL